MNKKEFFSIEDFREFNDYDNIMAQAFGVGCSLCGLEEIMYTSINCPKEIGLVVKEIHDNNPNISDSELDSLLKDPIEAWQEVDDYNSSIGAPTFLCIDCYDQLISGEIKVSNIKEN
ncbi:hypothetical protein SLITO_v1c07900 [Spiroplasma litorale]|uniref:Uncharacterized protein n=1 Tax=Spiroplasma litorale TaxID=216942 RepID=A0A0K1W258_9MOLU|nr:hypothetical protein [Spiroplasma litorale]AKX34409.1 hypothetical protein SLITO_v1c07900 [Spiroplasma litorale]